MKKIMILLFIVLFSSNIYGSCSDYNMKVVELNKNESCYNSFIVSFEDRGCESGCFEDVSSFIIKQGDKVLKNTSNISTTYYFSSFRNPTCNSDDISLIVYDKNSHEICREDFVLNTTYKQIEDKKIVQENIIEQSKSSNNDEVKLDEIAPKIAAKSLNTKSENVETKSVVNTQKQESEQVQPEIIVESNNVNSTNKNGSSNLNKIILISFLVVLIIVSLGILFFKNNNKLKKKSKKK